MEIHESIHEIFRSDRRVADLFYGLYFGRHPERVLTSTASTSAARRCSSP